jgi:hypothetical protein
MKRLLWMVAFQLSLACLCNAQATTSPDVSPFRLDTKVRFLRDYRPQEGAAGIVFDGSAFIGQNVNGQIRDFPIPANPYPFAIGILPDKTGCLLAINEIFVVDFSKSATKSVWKEGLIRAQYVFNEKRSRLAIESVQFNPSRNSVIVFNTKTWTSASLELDKFPNGLAFDNDTLYMASHLKLLSVDTTLLKTNEPLHPVTVSPIAGQLLAMRGQAPVSFDNGDVHVGPQKKTIGQFDDVGAYSISDSVLVWGRTNTWGWKLFRIRDDHDAEKVGDYPTAVHRPGGVIASGTGGHNNFFWHVIDEHRMVTIDQNWKPEIIAVPDLH